MKKISIILGISFVTIICFFYYIICNFIPTDNHSFDEHMINIENEFNTEYIDESNFIYDNKINDKIDKKLSVITEIRKENKEIFTRIDKVEKKMDAVYLINQKKIDTKYDKKIKDVSNTRVDTTASILSGLLNDKLEQ